MDTRGRHILAELDGCDRALLAQAGRLRAVLEEAARSAGLTVLAAHVVQFPESGVSGVLILAESHFSIHTWPEQGYAAVDLYTCGPRGQPDQAIGQLADRLHAGRVRRVEVRRGEPRADGGHDLQLVSMDRNRLPHGAAGRAGSAPCSGAEQGCSM